MESLGVGPLTPVWRLLVSGGGNGPWNMALDEALMDSVREGGPPFLRFYSWRPATLSLGRFQNPSTGLATGASGVPRVRRVTGGGAIWHDSEVTYSLGCAQEHVGVRGVKASFERLTGFLLDTWSQLGWSACYAKDFSGSQASWGAFTPACFAGTEEYDILVDGKKLGGNAQRRDRTTIFQHGSVPLHLDRDRLANLFEPGFLPSPSTTTDLESCGWNDSPSALVSLLSEAFRKRFGELKESQPTPREGEWASWLATTRYADPRWTEGGAGSLRSP